MKKKINFLLLSMCFYSTSLLAQTSNATNPAPVAKDSAVAKKTTLANVLQKVTVYGFVRTDIFYNSRKNFELRDGVLPVYPLAPLISNGQDLNQQSQLGFTAIVTRLGVRFDGVKALGANASGILEGDFFGVTNNTTFTPTGSPTNQTFFVAGTQNLFRLRHAHVKLDWNKVSLLVGQYWNPNFIAKMSPGVANFNAGIPFNPFSFVPQARMEYNFAKGFTLTAMAFGYSVSGFSPAVPPVATPGIGTTDANILSGIEAQRYSSVPSFALQLSYENEHWLVGLGAESNTLRPHTLDLFNKNSNKWGDATGVLNTDYFTQKFNKTFTAFNGLAYLKYTSQPVTAKVYANVGQAYTQYAGLGGFATYRDVKDGKFVYKPQNQLNLWTEIAVTKHPMFQPALFVGYDRNLGLANKINPDNVQGGLTAANVGFAGRAIGTAALSTYQDFVRIAPRLDILSGKLRFSVEYEWDYMMWGNPDLATFKVASNKKAATNNRVLFIAVYNF